MTENRLASHGIKFPVSWLIGIISFVFGVGMTWGIFGFRLAAVEARMDVVEPKVEAVGRLDERTIEMNKKLDRLLDQQLMGNSK